MKGVLGGIIFMSLLSLSSASAQTPSQSDPTGLISVKTDPVLRGPLTAVADLVAMLKSKGVKVESRIIEKDGYSLLELTVNGRKYAPFVVQCNSCAIEFEY